jgi:hypothetical protein
MKCNELHYSIGSYLNIKNLKLTVFYTAVFLSWSFWLQFYCSMTSTPISQEVDVGSLKIVHGWESAIQDQAWRRVLPNHVDYFRIHNLTLNLFYQTQNFS